MTTPAGPSAALLGRWVRIGSLFLAGAGTLLFLALFLLSSRDLGRQEAALVDAAPTEAWLVYQLVAQLHHLQLALAHAGRAEVVADGDGQPADPAGRPDGAADIALQLDLLWSRIDLLLTGPETGALVALPATAALHRDLRQALERIDALSPLLQSGDLMAVGEAEASLQRLDMSVEAFAQSVLHRRPKDQRAATQAQSARLELYLSMMLGLGLLFILLLGAEFRRNRRLATAAGRARQRATNESAAKSLFLATVSHEIQTPLNAISGFAELIERQPFGPVGNEKYLEYARDIIASTAHLRGLLDDVTDAQLVLQGRISLEDEDVELRPFLAETLRIVRANCTGRYLAPRIETRVASLVLRADRRRLRQVLINLMTNAIRYSDGQAQIEVQASMRGPVLQLEISDNGRGIAPEDMARVFEPFQRGRQPHGGGAPGMGLGLTIVRSIVEAHGGRVRMTSNLGVGTTVALIFPEDRLVRDRSLAASRLQGVAAE